MAAPHLRQIAPSSRRATGPPSASWVAPSGSWLVVKSHFGYAEQPQKTLPVRRARRATRWPSPFFGQIDLEGQLLGRRRAVALDEVAVRVSRAAHERPEPATARGEDPLAALRAGLARPRQVRGLVAGQRPGLLVLGVERAGKEPSVPAEPDHHRVPERTDLVADLGREVRPSELLALLRDPIPEWPVERLEQRDPRPLAPGDLVELLLHAGR